MNGKPPIKHSRKKTRSSQSENSNGYAQPPNLLTRSRDMAQLSGGWLMIISLIIGPLLAGSYYEPWRWPLIYTSSAGAALLILSTRPKKSFGWCLALLLLWPVIQGYWMWYNAWGEFSQIRYFDPTQLPWRIATLPDQPFPELPGTTDKAEAMDKLNYILPCLGLVWGTRQIVAARPSWVRIIAKSIFWSGVAVAIIGLAQRTTGSTSILWLDELDQGLLRKHFFATYRSPAIATCYLNVALAMGLSNILTMLRTELEIKSDKKKKKSHPMARLIPTTAGVIILICAVITAGSKAGMVFGVLTIILFCIINRNAIEKALRKSSEFFVGNKALERNIIIATIVCITLFALLSFAGVITERWSSAHKLNYSSMTGRIQANQVMMKMVDDDAWGAMGMGPGSFFPLFPYYTSKIDTMIMGVWVYAHNDYLQTLVEWGWLGTLCFTAIIGGGFFLLAREIFFRRLYHRTTSCIYLRGYLVAMTLFLIHASIDFPFQIESLAIIFSVILGVAWSAVDLRSRDSSNYRRRSKKRLPQP